MLSWICPECGRENDPAFEECPGCTPGVVKPQAAQQRRAGRRAQPQPAPVSLTFDTDYATAPFIDLAALRIPPPAPSGPAGLARSVEWEARPRVAPARPTGSTPEISQSAIADYPTRPFIDPALLGIPLPLPSAPAGLAGSVEWEARPRVAPARPADSTPEISQGAIRAEWRTDSPAATALAEPVTTALALAPQVDALPEPFVFRTLAQLDQCNPLPWTTVVRALNAPQPYLTPDHSSVLGMEADLLSLLEGLRQSPNCALLGGGKEESPLPARIEARWLARPQDLEYIPTPRTLAQAVAWHPGVQAAPGHRVVEDIPADARKWPGRRGELPRTPQSGTRDVAVLSPLAERMQRLWVRPERRRPAAWNTALCARLGAFPSGQRPTDARLPSELRGFHENGIFARLPMMRAAHKAPVPGWMVSLLTALVIILISTWVLERSAFDRFTLTRAEASTPSDAAQSAFPTMSKYVEVTGVRASTDTRTSEIRYVVVNHSVAELPPFALAVKLHPRRGNAVLCSFNATVPGMGPNESREMKTTVPRELHSYELPEWRDLRVETHVTAKQ